MSEVDVQVINERTMRDMLQDMMRRAQDLTPVWAKFGGVLVTHIKATFASAGAFVGEPWKPLTPRYAAWKLARIGFRPILVFNDDMRQSLTGRPMDIERYTPHSAVYGSTDPKLVHHQFGTRYMAARPPLVVTDPLNEELARLVAEHIVGDG